MKKLIESALLWTLVSIGMFILIHLFWESLGQLDYKMCTQVPNQTENCELRRP